MCAFTFFCAWRVLGLRWARSALGSILSEVVRSVFLVTSSTGASGLPHPVQRLVGAVESALDGAGDPLLVGLSDGELDQALVGLESVISRLQIRQLGLVGEARSRNRAGAGGAVSHARWLGLLLGADAGDAAGRVRAAAVLGAAAADPVAGPLVADARDGRSLLPQALRAARTVAGLPDDLPDLPDLPRDSRTGYVALCMTQRVWGGRPGRSVRVGQVQADNGGQAEFDGGEFGG